MEAMWSNFGRPIQAVNSKLHLRPERLKQFAGEFRLMDSRTADSLFGSSDDNSVDFFAQTQDPSSPTQAATPHEPQPVAEEQQTPYEQYGYSNYTEETSQQIAHDPYSRLQASPAVRTPSTARATTQRDPYAPHTNGNSTQNYAPSIASATPSTYSAPASQGAQYDPYASAIPRKPVTQQPVAYNPYSPASTTPQQGYSPIPSYAPQASPYTQPPQPALPKPPPPTNYDVSKYRSTPNAYDPPIRSKPVAKAPVRYATPGASSMAPNSVGSPYTNAPVPVHQTHPPHHQAHPPPPPPANTGYFPPVRQNPPPTLPASTSPPVLHAHVNGPPYGAKPPTPQTRQPMNASVPPPRAVSPYAYRAPGATSTPPPPRPSSTASNRSTGAYARPPSAPLSASGTHSRPASAASNAREGMRSPPRAPAITSTLSEPLLAVEETDLSDYLKVPQEDEDSLDMEGGGPTPRVGASVAGRSDYIEAGQSGIEGAYPPMEQDEILESMTLDNESMSQTPPADPYATLQRKPSLPYAPPNTYAMQPPQNITVESQASVPKPPVPGPKAIPPPRANPYAPSNITSPPQPPPSNGLTPSSSFRDAYAPPPMSNVAHLPPHSISTLAPMNSNPVIDLSHSPPNTRNIPSYDPYNPARGNLSRKNTASESDHGHTQPYGAPAYGYAPAPAQDAFGGAQYAAVSLPPAPINTAYAPSPSLLGTNDPLGRASVRVPIFSFGFGGRVVACFHNNPGMGAFDGMAPVRPSTMLTVKALKDFIPSSAYDVTQSAFPGPLFGDQGAGGATSVLQSAGAATKAKKAAIITWLDSMIKEAEGGFIYAGAASGVPAESAKSEGKLVLMKLLKVWIENDGKLSGSPVVEEGVRTALLGPPSESLTMIGGASAPAFGMPFYSGDPTQAARDSTITYQVKTSSLERLQELLIRGERRQAYQFALDEKLWSHALLISSSLDKDAWKEVAHEFIKTELGLGSGPDVASGKESLRLAYGLFAGDGPSAMKLLIPPTSFGVTGVQAHARVGSGPISGSDSPTSDATAVPEETWMQWKKLLASTIANQPLGDTTATTALGDYLLSNNWIDAAHCCYLLTPATSLFGGVGTPGVRAVLFGSANPATFPAFHTSIQPIVLSEIAEYAKSLVPTVKGQEPFSGFQHLQAYRLWHAACLAEMGEVVLAKRYTDAINATIRMSTRGSPYYTSTFMDQLEELHDRLVEAPHADKTKAWISKPSVRSLNEWITGGLEKLIQGDETPVKDEQPQGKKSLEAAPAVGPFSHYSAISSTTPSAHPSPSPSYANLHSASSSIGRTGSASGYRPPPTHSSTLPTPVPPRASSAMEYARGRASPAPKVSSAGATSTSFRSPYQPTFIGNTNTAEPASTEREGEPPRPLYAQWWGESNDDGVTPTATSFSRDGQDEDSGNFISLMDSDPTLVPSISTTSAGSSTHQNNFDDDDDDLGFGNSKRPKKDGAESSSPTDKTVKPSNGNASTSAPAQGAQPATPAQGDAAAAPVKGWFSWMRRNDATPKPVKASLGEESAFYYDAELKKWVNKKAGPDAAAPKVPPPPPSRAQTASPGRSGLPAGTATPPPPRAASVMPASSLAPPPRPSSTLSSTSESGGSFTDSAPPSRGSPAPPMSGMPPRAGQTPPPTSGSPAGSVRGAKRNARSRYVDVFQAP